MNTQTEKLKKYISECLEADLLAKKLIKEQHEKAYHEALIDIKVDKYNKELLFKRVEVARLKYGEALMYNRLWQNQNHLLT